MAGKTSDIQILMVQASPRVDPDGNAKEPLDTADELWQLCAAVERAKPHHSGVGTSWRTWPLRPQNEERLRRHLGRGYPIVHFCCHGDSSGLMMEDDRGVGKMVDGATLAGWMRPGNIKLAVISACQSETVGRILYDEGAAACIVATKSPIRDEEARRFCSVLYGELAQGPSHTIATAIEPARKVLSKPDDLIVFGDTSWTPASESRANDVLAGPDPSGHKTLFPFKLAERFVGRYAELGVISRWLDGYGTVMAISGLRGTGKTCLAVHAALWLGQDFKARVFVSAKKLPGIGPAQVLESIQKELDLPVTTSARPQDDIAGLLNKYNVFVILDSIDLMEPAHWHELAEALQGLDQKTCTSKVLLTVHALRVSERLLVSSVVPARDILRLDALHPADAVRLIFEAGRAETSVGLWLPAGRDIQDPGVWSKLLDHSGLSSFSYTAPMVGILDELAGLAFRHPPLLKLVGALIATGEAQGYDDAHTRLERLDYSDDSSELEKCRRELIEEKLTQLKNEAHEAIEVLYAAQPFVSGAHDSHLRYVVLGKKEFKAQDPKKFEKKALEPALASQLLWQHANLYKLPRPIQEYLEGKRHSHHDTYRLRHADALFERNLADLGRGNTKSALDWLAEQVRRRPHHDERPGEPERLLVAHAKSWVGGAARHQLSPEWIDAAGIAAERLGDTETEALTVEVRGDVYIEHAIRQYEEAVQRYRTASAPVAEANVLGVLGDLWRARSSIDPKAAERALSYYQDALKIFQERNDRGNQIRILESIAQLHFLSAQEQEARSCREQAQQLRSQKPDPATTL